MTDYSSFHNFAVAKTKKAIATRWPDAFMDEPKAGLARFGGTYGMRGRPDVVGHLTAQPWAMPYEIEIKTGGETVPEVPSRGRDRKSEKLRNQTNWMHACRRRNCPHFVLEIPTPDDVDVKISQLIAKLEARLAQS